MQGLKSVILATFQIGLGWAGWLCPVSAALKNLSQEFNNSFCFGCRLIPRKTIQRAHFSKVQSGKITVCFMHMLKASITNISFLQMKTLAIFVVMFAAAVAMKLEESPPGNQIRVVGFNIPQLTQASFLQKNQTL